MKKYLEKRDKEVNDIFSAMKELRDSEIENNGANAELFTEVVCELSYRVAKDPDEHSLCPNCETPIPKAEYDHYCDFVGSLLENKREINFFLYEKNTKRRMLLCMELTKKISED